MSTPAHLWLKSFPAPIEVSLDDGDEERIIDALERVLDDGVLHIHTPNSPTGRGVRGLLYVRKGEIIGLTTNDETGEPQRIVNLKVIQGDA